MKWIVAVLVLAGAGWYYFVGGRTLDEQMVRQHYEAERHAVLSRNPQAQCELLHDKLVARISTRMAGKTTDATLGKKEVCHQQQEQHRFFEDVGEKAGGMLTIEYEQDIRSITVAPDRKSAAVEITSTLKMGESFMVITSVSTDRVERHLGKVKTVGADAQTRVQWTPAAMLDPQKYFVSQ